MKLTFSPRAALDFEEIADYIAHDNPKRAVSFVNELKTRCDQLLASPLAFVTRHDIAPGLRMAVHGNYLILYSLQDDTVRVERIMHGARSLADLE